MLIQLIILIISGIDFIQGNQENKLKIVVQTMLNNDINPEVCDATMFNSSNVVGLKKNPISIISIIRLKSWFRQTRRTFAALYGSSYRQ